MELSHDPIDKWYACLSWLYRCHDRLIILSTDTIVDGGCTLELESRLIFELLDEVWLPVKPRVERSQWEEKPRISLLLQISHTQPCDLHHLPQWYTSIREIHRYTRARILSLDRSTHTSHIPLPTRYEKCRKCPLSLSFSSYLEFLISLEYTLPSISQYIWDEWFLWFWYEYYGPFHPLFPYLRPVITRAESPHYSVRRILCPGDGFLRHILAYHDISLIGDPIACLFVRVEMDDIILFEDEGEYCWYIPLEDDEWDRECTQRSGQIWEWVFDELSMKYWEVRCPCHSWLEYIKGDDRDVIFSSLRECLREWSMITYTEISLVPDEDDFLFFLHFSEQYMTDSQFSFHFFRLEKGRPHTGQILDSRYCPRSSIFIVYFSEYWENPILYTKKSPKETFVEMSTSAMRVPSLW